MSSSLLRPIARSCPSVQIAFQAGMSCKYFWTMTVGHD
jgi:hypothetical protein